MFFLPNIEDSLTKNFMKPLFPSLFVLSLAATCQFTLAQTNEKPAEQLPTKAQTIEQTPSMKLGSIRVEKMKEKELNS